MTNRTAHVAILIAPRVRHECSPRPAPRSIAFERNVVYFREGDLLAWNWKNGDFWFDRNVYWNTSGPITFAGATLDAWQKRGMDVHSIVADPLFVDPDHADFGLRAGSPALSIGFEPIDVHDVGPRR